PGAMAGCDQSVRLTYSNAEIVFQSSPGAMAGCDSAGGRPDHLPFTSFNPHPARWPGATLNADVAAAQANLVSILTRRDGRVRLLLIAGFTAWAALFQSSPGAMAGCDARPLPYRTLP